MEIFKNNIKNIVICDKDYLSYLFILKNNQKEFDIKYFDNNQIIDVLSFSYLKDPIPYLIDKYHIEYNKAKKIANLLKSENAESNNYLKTFIDDLKGEYIPIDKDNNIINNNTDLLLFKNANILLFENDENDLIINLLEKHNFPFKHIHFSDFGIKNNKLYQKPIVMNFKTKFDQYFYLFSNLREKLLSERKENLNKYIIQIEDQNDFYYIDYFAKLFKIEIFKRLKTPLSFSKVINKACKDIYESKSFELSNEDSNDLKVLISLIKDYKLKEISKKDFNFAYLNLLEIVKSKDFVEETTDKGVGVYSTFIFDPFSKIYVTNFMHGSFYKEFKDNNVISDKEIKDIGANPSYKLTLLDKRKKENFIKYLNIEMLSRVEQHLNDKIYDSQFVEIFNEQHSNKETKEKYNCIKTIKIDNEKLSMPIEAKHLFALNIKDKYYLKEDYKEVTHYNNKFKGIPCDSKFQPINKKLSVSRIKNYLECPFCFYLKKIIPNIDEEKHQFWKGELIHKVFENIYSDTFDYETQFALGVEAYKKAMEKEGIEFSKKEYVIVEIIKYWLKPIALSIRNEKYEIPLIDNTFFTSTSEINVNYKVADYDFTGKIDKIIFSQTNDDGKIKKYYTIIDYKSSSHVSSKFDAKGALVGYDIQLPLYFQALQGDDRLKDFTFGGMGIKHNYGSSINDAYFDKECKCDKDILIKKEIIKGLFIDDFSYYASMNNLKTNKKNENNKDSKYIDNKILLNPKNYAFEIAKNKEITLKKLLDEANKSIKETISLINNLNFDIKPIATDITKPININKLQCQYCSYRDVCYKSKTDFNDLNKKINEKIKKI